MVLFLHVLQACCISTLIASVDSYVIFAANLEDFRKLAMKFIPEKLAGELTEILSKSSLKYKQERDAMEKRRELDKDRRLKVARNENSREKVIYVERTTVTTAASEEVTKPTRFKRIQRKKPKENSNEEDHSVNNEYDAREYLFEKDKMYENEDDRSESTVTSLKRYRTVKRRPTSKSWYEQPMKYINDEENLESVKNSPIPYEKDESKMLGRDDIRTTEIEVTERDYSKQTVKRKKVKNKSPEKIPYREESEVETKKVKQRKVKKEEVINEEDMTFKKVMLGKKKDSYEDYVTPKKDYDFVSSETTKPLKVFHNSESKVSKDLDVFVSAEATDLNTEGKKAIKKPGVKKQFQSERMDDTKDLEEFNKENQEEVKARTESLIFNSKEYSTGTIYTMKGTGIPTREVYKMSSPDYYKKLPRIVEKYDFNEPIPEADREREVIDDKYVQEAAKVNKKVQQQQGRKKQEQNPLERLLEEIGLD